MDEREEKRIAAGVLRVLAEEYAALDWPAHADACNKIAHKLDPPAPPLPKPKFKDGQWVTTKHGTVGQIISWCGLERQYHVDVRGPIGRWYRESHLSPWFEPGTLVTSETDKDSLGYIDSAGRVACLPDGSLHHFARGWKRADFSDVERWHRQYYHSATSTIMAWNKQLHGQPADEGGATDKTTE